MKKIVSLAAAAAVLASASCTGGSQGTGLRDWTLSCDEIGVECPATVPSTVAGVLADNDYWGKDIMFGGNWFDVDKSIFDKTWTYKAKFDAVPQEGRFYTLRFEGLGFYSDLYLNGECIASSDTTYGAFIRRSFDVTDLVRRHNRLSVALRRAQSGDLNAGYVDWNPRPLDESMGILRDVVLSETGAVSVEDVSVRTDLDVNDFSYADITVRVSLRNHSAGTVPTTVVVDGEAGGFRCDLTLSPGASGEVVKTFRLDNPRVWWTYDLGTPELYDLKAAAVVDGVQSDEKSVTFGVREIESTIEEGRFRKFYLNGRPVQILGAGWTDEILMRDTHESIAAQIQLVKDMNLNCVRFENVWGKDSFVYDECDRQGIMTMVGFSCQWEWEDYCGLPETDHWGCISDARSMDLAVRYFHDQIQWMENHPSLIAWLTGSDRIPNPELEARYMEIYNRYEYRPYVCSAKEMTSKFGGPSGFKMEGPYNYVAPDYWYQDTEYGGAFGFNSETGIGPNIPQMESMARMMPADSLWPISLDWSRHCTASSSKYLNNPSTLVAEAEGQYGAAEDLEGFMCRAHAIDYDGTKAMFEAFRCNWPRATGVIQWMLNSAWPSMYWQLYDYWLSPTAGYYGTRKACSPKQLIYNFGDRRVYGISSDEPAKCSARIRLYDTGSALVSDQTVDACLSEVAVALTPEIRCVGGGYLSLELFAADGSPIADNFYVLPASSPEFDWDRTDWCYTPTAKMRDLSFIASAPVDMKVEKTDEGYRVTLVGSSERISYFNRLALVRSDGSLVAPAFWSDNFVSVLPGETKVLECRCNEEGTIKLYSWK